MDVSNKYSQWTRNCKKQWGEMQKQETNNNNNKEMMESEKEKAK